nr:type I-D CRISPR-associated helicase Cas3' [Oscillatoria sp. FACHB-1406]
MEPASISSCSDFPPELEFLKPALQHQVDVYQAGKSCDIILDLAATGTGKTKAGLSLLLHNPQRNAVYVAPTNALIDQQTEAAAKFVRDANLPHIVKAASAAQVHSWRNDRVGKRSGEKIYNVLREPATLFPECGGGKPILLVTNPDIFYYAAFFQYNRLDRANLASEFYSSFATVIFDEFHLYSAKQLVSLFFYLALSQVFGYFQHNRKIVLLTATPEPACEEALNLLSQHGVRIARIDGTSQVKNLIPSQTEVRLELRKYLDKESMIAEIAAEVIQRLQERPNQYGAVILDSKDTLNRISSRLTEKGYKDLCGRITGDTPKEKRHAAAQKQIILATSTVDVGFNFERENSPSRQNLDWLIFSARDRASFWQRVGRVGRVLGKPETTVASEAIAYLPEKAWEEGITELDLQGGREALKGMLENLSCMKHPFLEIYWRSEAFLEMARPLLELQCYLAGLPEESLVLQLYNTLQSVLNGKRDWDFQRKRMNVILGAENIVKAELSGIKKKWKDIKGGQSCVISFLRANYPEEWEDVKSNRLPIEKIEEFIRADRDKAEELLEYAKILTTSYNPLFQFRENLLPNVKIYDPHNFLLDEVGETNLDPLHLMRFYEFISEGDRIIVTHRAEETYQLVFELVVHELEEFKARYLCKLYAFENCTLKRTSGGSIRSTALLQELTPSLMPGVIVREHQKNRWAICKLRRQGIDSYPIVVDDLFEQQEYLFFPSLSGILAIAAAGIALKCPDNEEFWIAQS